jgi:hypothetical protein
VLFASRYLSPAVSESSAAVDGDADTLGCHDEKEDGGGGGGGEGGVRKMKERKEVKVRKMRLRNEQTSWLFLDV